MIEKGKKAHDAFAALMGSVQQGYSNWNDLTQGERDAWAECERAITRDALTCPACHILTIERCGNCGEDMF